MEWPLWMLSTLPPCLRSPSQAFTLSRSRLVRNMVMEQLSGVPTYPSSMSSLRCITPGDTLAWSPTMLGMPFSTANAVISSACCTLAARGHSVNTGLLARRAAMVIS